jgi:GT2 family glycosyltransferase/glycosyltransferase involved in cell wall biosynthesis
LPEPILVAFATGEEKLWPEFFARVQSLRPDLPLWVVAEFPVSGRQWIPYRIGRSIGDNVTSIRWTLRGKQIALCALILQPNTPHWPMRRAAFAVGGLRSVFYNENLDHFMLRPPSAPAIVRHFLWRLKNYMRTQTRPGGWLYTWVWRLRHPKELRRPFAYRRALWAGKRAAKRAPEVGRARQPRGGGPFKPSQTEGAQAGRACPPSGISVVIPSRNGRELIERLLASMLPQLEPEPHEIIVVDNGSSDGTSDWLAQAHPAVKVMVSREPMSFAAAVNRGIGEARHSHTLLLNNDMTLEPGFFPALRAPFGQVPDLFCSTAEILFPPGQRREETGKAVWRGFRDDDGFPIHCIEPAAGESLTPVLYGSGGCSLYDTAKLRALGGMKEIFAPAYVEDLDLGYRAWKRGWPSVIAGGARLVHRHRATTSRYFDERQIERAVELNFLRFVATAAGSAGTFAELWTAAIRRLNHRAAKQPRSETALDVLCAAHEAADLRRPEPSAIDEQMLLALTSGDVAVFPGRGPRTGPRVMVASPYSPFPLSHGGAVRIYNLMRRAQAYTQVLVCYADELGTPAAELLDICAEIVLVRRRGSHARPDTARPDAVEEFDTPAFRAAMEDARRRWRPEIVQLEYTQMAAHAEACRPARTILVEHDVTIDLYEQLLARQEDWETRRQYERWLRFETEAWKQVDAVVVMSEKDRARLALPHAVTLANGVDLGRFQPSEDAPEPGRLLFIGSFAHLPNLLALDWFLREVWPRLSGATLHVIAGRNHREHLARSGVALDLGHRGVEAEGFVSDPRGAYRRAEVVIAPLLASAGTNIKIMEAMAMGKAIVSTPGGVNGLDEIVRGEDVLVESEGAAFAAALMGLLANPGERKRIERNARARAEAVYSWDRIAERQAALYESLMPKTA